MSKNNYTVYNNFDIIRYQGTTYDKQGNFYDTNYKVYWYSIRYDMIQHDIFQNIISFSASGVFISLALSFPIQLEIIKARSL